MSLGTRADFIGTILDALLLTAYLWPFTDVCSTDKPHCAKAPSVDCQWRFKAQLCLRMSKSAVAYRNYADTHVVLLNTWLFFLFVKKKHDIFTKIMDSWNIKLPYDKKMAYLLKRKKSHMINKDFSSFAEKTHWFYLKKQLLLKMIKSIRKKGKIKADRHRHTA